MKWKYKGYKFYNFWRNPFSRYFNFDIGIGGGWEISKKEMNVYCNFCGFYLTLFFMRQRR